MTPEQELVLLIEEQTRDDTYQVWPERHVDFSLDATTPDGEMTFGDSIGVDLDGEVHVYLRRRKGVLLGASFHGTENGYSNHECRCPRCTNAHRIYYNERRARQRRQGHGSIQSYWRGCKCRQCKTAEKLRYRKRNGIGSRFCQQCHKPMAIKSGGKKFCRDACKHKAHRARLKAAA